MSKLASKEEIYEYVSPKFKKRIAAHFDLFELSEIERINKEVARLKLEIEYRRKKILLKELEVNSLHILFFIHLFIVLCWGFLA